MKIDIEWVRQQMTKAQIHLAPGNVALQLLEIWELCDLTEEQAKEAVEVFGKLSLGHALVPDEIDELSGSWAPAQPGQIVMSDIVRVLPDAFTGDLGVAHNGRIGRVVGIRYGDIVVDTIDNRAPLRGAHYSPHMLEKLYPN